MGTPGGARTALSRPQEQREGEERTESRQRRPSAGPPSATLSALPLTGRRDTADGPLGLRLGLESARGDRGRKKEVMEREA